MMRKICVVTTTRAEYGTLSNLIRKIDDDKELQLQLLVSGTHLSKKFGYTVDEIKSPILRKIDIEIEVSPEHASSLAIEKFSKVFAEIKPDLIVLLGDRYEILGVAIAAMLKKIPIVHIHGGENTYGTIDEAIRHSITKMSHIHFTSCEQYRQRVIQLGEYPDKVFNVGSLAVESINLSKLIEKEKLNVRLWDKNLLITYHPVAYADENVDELLRALENFTDINLIFTMPGAERGSDDVCKKITEFVSKHENAAFYESLGHLRYLSTMRYVNGVVGNSSSGILEAPSFNIGTVNIGCRQDGRVRASSIIDCPCMSKDIICAIKELYRRDFSNTKNPYDKKNTSDNIIQVIKKIELTDILKKRFFIINKSNVGDLFS